MRGDTAPPSSKNPQQLDFSFAPWAAAMGLTLLRYELIDGSGGPGTQRGGRVYRAEADCRMHLGCSRLRSAPSGLAGDCRVAAGASISDPASLHSTVGRGFEPTLPRRPIAGVRVKAVSRQAMHSVRIDTNTLTA